MYQYFKNIKKGFTLVEIMVVIGLLALFAALVGTFRADVRIYQERVQYLAQTVADLVSDARYNTIIGRSAYTEDGSLQSIQSREFAITKDAFGVYYEDKKPEKEYSLQNGFLDNDTFYKVESIEIAKSPDDAFVEVEELKMRFLQNGFFYDKNNPVRRFRITVEYRGFKRYIVGDALSGVISIYNRIENEDSE